MSVFILGAAPGSPNDPGLCSLCVFFPCFPRKHFPGPLLPHTSCCQRRRPLFTRLQIYALFQRQSPSAITPPTTPHHHYHPSYCLESKRKGGGGGGGLSPSSLVRGFTLPQAIIFPPSLPLLVPSGSQLKRLFPGFLGGHPSPTEDQLLPDVGGYLKAAANAEPYQQLAGERSLSSGKRQQAGRRRAKTIRARRRLIKCSCC